jgi:hypothetical protein
MHCVFIQNTIVKRQAEILTDEIDQRSAFCLKKSRYQVCIFQHALPVKMICCTKNAERISLVPF